MTVIRAILFDKDGTLLDFEASWAGAYRELTLDLTGGDSEAAAALLAVGGFDTASGRFEAGSALAAGTTPEIVRLWYPALLGDLFTAKVAEIDRAFHANGIRYSVALPGIPETLASLAAMGFVMGVATNDGTEAARAAVDAIGLGKWLPHIFGYDSVPHPKPAPDSVLAFASMVGAVPAEIAVVGDNRRDLEMARSAGAIAVGVLSGTGARADLELLADIILPSINELPAWLAQNRK